MIWHRKSKWHEEAEGGRWFLCATKSVDGWKFLLTDRNTPVGWFSDAAEAKATAEELEGRNE